MRGHGRPEVLHHTDVRRDMVLTNNQCDLLFTAGYSGDQAYQKEFAPLGVPTTCARVTGTARARR